MLGDEAGDGVSWVACNSIGFWVSNDFRDNFIERAVVKFGYCFHAIKEYVQL